MAAAVPGRRSPALTGRLLLAADHRARGVITIERYDAYLSALTAALPWCDGILASAQPLRDLASAGSLGPGQQTYLSINRTGLAGAVFELDDRLVASVEQAANDGWTGIKHMTRIDLSDSLTASALELLGRVLEQARAAGVEALIECVPWRDHHMDRAVDAIVLAAVVAHDLGAPLLKVPVPDAPPGQERVAAVARVVASVGVPVLFLGGPRESTGGDQLLAEVADVMAGGGAGLALGRRLFEDPDPAGMAKRVAEILRQPHGPGQSPDA